jgi:BMFP domain-containing protein YqiC
MDRQTLLQDVQKRLGELLRASPAADLERNLKALMAQSFQKMDLVTREEFEIQAAMIERLRQRIDVLESRLTDPAPGSSAPPSSGTP